jgi:drug/metabolite transporter (DMT)-like permease
MSDEGVRLVMRAALVIVLIITTAFVKVAVGPSKRRGRIMLAGTLGGFSSGVLIAYPIQERFGVEVSVTSACLGMMLGWAVAWMWAKRIPREAS